MQRFRLLSRPLSTIFMVQGPLQPLQKRFFASQLAKITTVQHAHVHVSKPLAPFVLFPAVLKHAFSTREAEQELTTSRRVDIIGTLKSRRTRDKDREKEKENDRDKESKEVERRWDSVKETKPSFQSYSSRYSNCLADATSSYKMSSQEFSSRVSVYCTAQDYDILRMASTLEDDDPKMEEERRIPGVPAVEYTQRPEVILSPFFAFVFNQSSMCLGPPLLEMSLCSHLELLWHGVFLTKP